MGIFDKPKENIFEIPNKGSLFPSHTNKKLKLFDESLLQPEEPPAAKHVPIDTNSRKWEIFRLYNQQGELLFVTKSPQLQALRSRPWYKDIAVIKVEMFDNNSDQENEKFMAIRNENPKYNKHSA